MPTKTAFPIRLMLMARVKKNVADIRRPHRLTPHPKKQELWKVGSVTKGVRKALRADWIHDPIHCDTDSSPPTYVRPLPMWTDRIILLPMIARVLTKKRRIAMERLYVIIRLIMRKVTPCPAFVWAGTMTDFIVIPMTIVPISTRTLQAFVVSVHNSIPIMDGKDIVWKKIHPFKSS